MKSNFQKIINSFLLYCFFILKAESKNENSDQQTFVVRYKNGDQTIPVTVVLDYRKQTEHVINMNPRSPAKSVTLYDFKQKTIAYKDVTNKECFLGHLTYETLNQEKEALDELKSPVGRSPKHLKLVPDRPALTPTEIRNMAGLKTAVFCRKMNTWLITSTNENRKRRSTEIEEHNYSHHGYRSVQFGHYGQASRRRYRTPGYKDSKSDDSTTQIASQNESTKKGARGNHVPGRNALNSQVNNFDTHYATLSTRQNRKNGVNINGNHTLPLYEHLHRPFSRPEYTDSFEKLENKKFPDPSTANNGFHHTTNKEDFKENLNIYHPDTIVKKKNNHSRTWTRLPDTRYQESKQIESSDDSVINSNLGLGNDRKLSSYTNEINDYNNSYEDKFLNVEQESNVTLPDIIWHEGNIEKHKLNHLNESEFDFSTNVLEVPKITRQFENYGLKNTIEQSTSNDEVSYVDVFEHNLNHLNKNNFQIPLSYHQFKSNQTLNSDLDYGQISSPDQNSLYNPNANFAPIRPSHVTGQEFHVGVTNDLDELMTSTLDSDRNHFRVEPTTGDQRSDTHKDEDNQNNNDLTPDDEDFDFSQVTPPAIQEGIFPQYDRFPSVLRHYKPDEIVIDIENVPTFSPDEVTPPTRTDTKLESTAYKHHPNRLSVSFESRNIPHTRIDTGGKYNSRSAASHHGGFDKTYYISRVPSVPHHRKFSSVEKTLKFTNNQGPGLDALPPGVSFHPRHPKAPYADIFPPNPTHTLPQPNFSPSVPQHRHRHFRRKMHPGSSCCGHRSISNSIASRRILPRRKHCCSQTKTHNHQPYTPRSNNAIPSQSRNRRLDKRILFDEKEKQCQKETLCRTVYESTRPVVICRNSAVGNCS